MKKVLDIHYIIIVSLLAIVLRLVNLGYSDFQGDEIKALYLPEQGQSLVNFLLEQRKGPLQFLITYLIKFIDPLFQNQFIDRLPFALAGILSVFVFYKLIKELYGSKPSFYATMFFVTNGFLIAFSRIVQYQSLVILFMLSSLLFLKKKHIYLGLITWALSILAHYDGIFIFPLAFYFIYEYLADSTSKELIYSNFFKLKISLNKKHLLNFLTAGFISVLILLSFYLPFVFSVLKDTSTQSYWLGRITGEVSSKLSSSRYLFTVYQPIYVIHIYLVLSLVGLFSFLVHIFKTKIQKNKFLKNLISESHNKYSSPIFLWLLFSFIFMELLVYIPGTHIYTYLIPLMIFMGLGIDYGIQLLNKIIPFKFVNTLIVGLLTILFIFITAQSYFVFVDNTREYPWEEESFMFWTFPKPTPIFHLSMFGFPYYRNWEGIQDFILSSSTQPAYSTNERESIARHYISLPKGTDEAGFYVYIRNPQTFSDELTNKKVQYWSSKYEPKYVFQKNGRDLVQIYVMEPGDLKTLQLKGF